MWVLFKTSRTTQLLSNMSNLFYCLIFSPSIYSFNPDDQPIGYAEFRLKNASSDKGLFILGFISGGYFFFILNFLFIINKATDFFHHHKKMLNNIKNLKDKYEVWVFFLLTGLASAIQSPRGLRCQILLLPHVQGCCFYGVETVFCSESLW